MEVRERPIIFSGESVRAILAGKKTQTRRTLSPEWWRCLNPEDEEDRDEGVKQCPHGAVGDRLWVRETFFEIYDRDTMKPEGRYLYAATHHGEVRQMDENGGTALRKDGTEKSPWKSPLFMPRAASRLTLDVTLVRVERLHEISDEDGKAEGQGMTWGGGCFHRSYAGLWDAINAKRGLPWSSNPWVWVLSFRRSS